MTEYRKKMIEVAMPLEAINAEGSRRKRKAPKGFPTQVHWWQAQRPLANCIAVLFGQMVDDPSSWPDRFPTEEAQDAERLRLFRILEELVLWENSNNTRVLNAARKEIAQSLARNRVADGEGTERDGEVLAETASPEVVNAYLAEVAPPVHDPFAGGGSIPLEAQRLGLRAIATDLNPVAVLINKALIEIPPKFAGSAPVHPKADQRTNWSGAEGLAEDVRRYGEWMRDEAKKRIGHLYPEVDLPEEHGGGKATVIAWLWARTVESPDPAFKGVHVPLVSNFFLSTRKGKESWIEPVIEGRDYRFEVRTGKPENPKAIREGTKVGHGGNFRCVMSGAPIGVQYIREQGSTGRMGSRLMAVVAKASRQRIYRTPTESMETVASSAEPASAPNQEINHNPRDIRTQLYGLTTYADLFTPRQIVALTTFSDLVLEARDKAIADARAAGWDDKGNERQGEGASARAYGDAIAVYAAMAMSRVGDYGSSLATWRAKDNAMRSTIPRQAIPMVWDYAEANPFAESSGGVEKCLNVVASVLDHSLYDSVATGVARQASAMDLAVASEPPAIVSTDPPYFDNVGYADLSDFFYVWLRRSLRSVLPNEFSTLLVPKADELISSSYRHGGRAEATEFFEKGMVRAMSSISSMAAPAVPVTVFYAYKQEEVGEDGVSATGWSTFLEGILRAGLQVTGTLPLRSEGDNRQNSQGANALASSILLVCRQRATSASAVTRGDFRRLLVKELPPAIQGLQKGNVAPVDMSQASIGPGMAVFSRYSKVIEADGSAMSVRTALQIINEVVDEVRGGEEMDLDAETRFAITWFETHGFAEGAYGDSETLATSRNVSVESVARAGLLHTAAGKTRLLTREQLPEDWDPATDTTLTVWECTQHLIKRLEEKGEGAASSLLNAIGPRAEAARTLAYRLYTHCERKGDAEEARAYNGLVVAWPELERLASQNSSTAQPASSQAGLFEGNN